MAIPNRGPELFVVNVVFVAVAALAVSLRIFVRLRMVRAWGIDDWLMVVAMLFYTGYIISSIIGVHYGTGRHHRDLSEHGVRVAKHCWYFCYLFYSLAMIAAKLSIGCLLVRISVRRLHTYIIYAAMLTSIVAGGTFFFVCLFQCDPVSFMWNKGQKGTCIENTVITALGYIYSIFSIMSDFTFTIIPGFLVWNLQLKRRTKFALIPLITMGCIASSAVLARLPFVKEFNSPDFLWATLDIAIWSSIEQGLAITAGSLATIRPLFFLVMHHLGISTRGPYSANPSHYAMSAPPPTHAYSTTGLKSHPGKLRPDDYHLSTTVKSRPSSDDDSLPRPGDYRRKSSAAHWADYNESKKSHHAPTATATAAADNESQRSLRNRDSEEDVHHEAVEAEHDEDPMHIMVSKSFYVTDEERTGVV